MADQNEIFEQYALLRLLEDSDLTPYEYLDSSEFHLAKSPSLEFLAKETDVTLQEAASKWITEDSTEENGGDYYRDEPQRVLVIKTDEILQARRENIKRILPKLPKHLAENIKAFEKNTEYLYAKQFSSTKEVMNGLEKALNQFESNNTVQRLIVIHAKRIDPTPSKREQNKIKQLTLKEAVKEEKQKRFYQLIADIHNPRNKDKRTALYEKLLKALNNRDPEDIRHFMGDENYNRLFTRIRINYLKKKRDLNELPPKEIIKHVNKTILRLATTELKRDVYEQLCKLYKAEMNSKAKFFEQDLEAYNKACDRFAGRLLGPKGAFEAGGIYGPDSQFSGQIIQNKGQNAQTPNAVRAQKPAENKKEDKLLQLKIFSDKDFEL